MSKSLRLAFPGSIWHITGRGNEKRDIVFDDEDRSRFLGLLGRAAGRFGWLVYAYVLMTNHYHFVIELTSTSLSTGMHWLNSCYAQSLNKRHGRVGHLFQGPFDGGIVEKDTYLLDVLRYNVLNPVRAGMVRRPEDYP